MMINDLAVFIFKESQDTTFMFLDAPINNPARSLTRVGLLCTATLTLTVYQHGLDLPSPTLATSKAGPSMACVKVAQSCHDHRPGGCDELCSPPHT
jgi:hypothetical protein